MRCFILCGVTIGFVTLAAAASGVESESTFKLHPVEEKILKETNAQRARYGLKALEMDPALVESARQHASWMCSTGNFTHTSKSVGENIALGQRSAKEALGDWMNSSGHRANILSGDYTRIGVAAYQIGEDGQIYWCQQFLR